MIIIDQMQREITLSDFPKRIISLVPSQTELLWDLGLRDELVGITKFCIHPEEMFNTKPRVGGTKQFDFEKIQALKPDLIIGNKEENEKDQIEELTKHYPVWMSDILTLNDALDMISRVGELVNKKNESIELVKNISANFHELVPEQNSEKIRTAYFIWQNPFMVAGHSTFINEMLKLNGFKNVFENVTASRYPEISSHDIIKADPELILLSSEPYPFKDKHLNDFKEMLPNAKVMIVDGEMFSWYGSRLLQAPAYFKKLQLNLSLL